MTMNPKGRAGRRERAQGRTRTLAPQPLAQAPSAAAPPQNPWLPALTVLFIGLLMLALTVVLEFQAPDRPCRKVTAGCSHIAASPVPPEVSDAAHTLGALHSLGYILALPVCLYLSIGTPWSAFRLKRGPSKRCMELAWLGAVLVGINSLVLTVHFAYTPLVDRAWKDRGGVMVPYQDVPKNRRDLKPGDALGAAYHSGWSNGILLGFLLLGAAAGINSLRTKQTRRR